MSTALAGFTVVVTRPAQQSAGFTALVIAHGARAIAYPVLAIEPISIDQATRDRLAPDRYDWVIYTSANAVRLASRILPPVRRAKVAAIGPATARALAGAGIAVDALSAERADSEGVLGLPAFASPAGVSVLIVRGETGRGLIRDELRRRGATVEIAELYRRVAVTPSVAAVDELARALGQPDRTIIAVTSGASLAALAGVTPAALVPRLRRATLLLPGTRVASIAREHGWGGPLIVAASAEDSVMFDALVAHCRSHPAGGGPLDNA